MRYRDNYLFALDRSRPEVRSDPGAYLAAVARGLQDAVGLPLQVEGWGESVEFFETTLVFTNGFPDVGLKAPLAFAPLGSPTPP